MVTWKYGENFLIFSSEIWFDTFIGTDSRDLVNGYLLCLCVNLR